MRLSELKQIIRECIEESFLVDELESIDETTPNQRAHPRPPVGRYGKDRKWNAATTRTNTVYGGEDLSSHQPVYYDDTSSGDSDIVKSGPRKGKLHKSIINMKKDTIKRVRDARGPKSRKDYDRNDWNDGEYIYPNRGRMKQKKLKQSSYKQSGIGRKGR